MPKPATALLLRRLAAPFAVALLALTTVLLVNYAVRQLPQLSARGASAGTLIEVVLLAFPFTLAMTIPMAVFVAVLWGFTRLGSEGVLAAAREQRGGVRQLVTPVLKAAAVVAALTLVSNTLILPRANARLSAILAGGASTAGAKSDRAMTIGELRTAAHDARASSRPDALSLATRYEVEIHKKYALGVAGIALALFGAAVAFRFPRGGVLFSIVASFAVFSGYYACLIAAESLADRAVISPVVVPHSAESLATGT
jgi:lipopolysaccharide export LptBFGC system permease protein LptF